MRPIGRAITGLAVAAVLGAAAPELPTIYRAAPVPEPEAGPVIRTDGDTIAIDGDFTAGTPPLFADVLADAPRVRTVRLDSPGGPIGAALAVAEIIRAHRLDTTVGQLCASACTLAFLAGRQRSLPPDARLGFHQAFVTGEAADPPHFDAVLRSAYTRFGVPAWFVDRVLRTPPDAIWYPDRDDLRAAGFLTDPAVVATGDRQPHD